MNDTSAPLALAPDQAAGEAAALNGPDGRVWRVAAVVVLGPFMTLLDATVVNVALPTIRQDLHSSITSAQWIVSGYMLALALMLPLSARLVDRVGGNSPGAP